MSASRRERIARRLQATGRNLAGDRGGRIANKVSGAIGCGTVTLCARPSCPNCAPLADGTDGGAK